MIRINGKVKGARIDFQVLFRNDPEVLKMSGKGKTKKSGNQKAFSLIELIIVVSVLSILAAVISPQVTKLVEKSKIGRLENDLSTIKTAVGAIYADIGLFPAERGSGRDPALAEDCIVPYPHRYKWDGPYIDRWPEEHPWGGEYDYEYWGNSDFNYDGTWGNEAFVTVRDNLTVETLNRIDKDLDDGNRYSGTIRHDGYSYLRMFIAEGESW